MKGRCPRTWHSVATHILLPFHFPPLYLPKHLQPSEGKRKELMSCLVAMGTSCLREKEWRISGPTVAYWPLTHVSKKCLDIEVSRRNICISFFFIVGYFILFFLNFIFKLYIIVLVLPNIKMNPPQVYMCSPSIKSTQSQPPCLSLYWSSHVECPLSYK